MLYLCLHFVNKTNPHILFSYQLESSERCNENEQIGIDEMLARSLVRCLQMCMCVRVYITFNLNGLMVASDGMKIVLFVIIHTWVFFFRNIVSTAIWH